MTEIFERIRSIFEDVFPTNQVEIRRETSAKDIEDWDSLMHVNLIVTVEKEFGIRLKTSRIAKLKNASANFTTSSNRSPIPHERFALNAP